MPDSISTESVQDIDIEQGLPSSEAPSAIPLRAVTEKLEADSKDTQGRNVFSHTNNELLSRARKINESGRFIFACYSELNTFLLLRAQDDILRLQNKLEDSVTGTSAWTDNDSNDLQQKLRQYYEGLSIQKEILNWDRPPFKQSRSAGDFLRGKGSAQKRGKPSFSVLSSSVGIRPTTDVASAFDGSDYVDLYPENSSPLHSFLRKLLPKHIIYNWDNNCVKAYLLESKNQDNPIWRGSSASISNLSRVVISLISVGLLVAPMFALTYIRQTAFLLLAAALFASFFAIVFAVSSRARNHEVFGVTAAYAAVLMVFVGNAIQGNYATNNGN